MRQALGSRAVIAIATILLVIAGLAVAVIYILITGEQYPGSEQLADPDADSLLVVRLFAIGSIILSAIAAAIVEFASQHHRRYVWITAVIITLLAGIRLIRTIV